MKTFLKKIRDSNLDLKIYRNLSLASQRAMMADSTAELTTIEDASKPSKRAQRKLKRQIAKERRKEFKQQSKGLTKNPDPGFDKSYFDLTDYYFENGLRKVYPYYFTFSTYAKQRWVGKPVLDIFLKDFHGTEKDEYIENINSGKVKVNGKQVTPDFIVKNNQFLEHTLHRHENPVVGTPIEIIADDEDIIVINKPASIPCHPCGRYRFNSIAFILGKEYGYCNLRNIYRLDRLTSGVLILAKTAEKTRELEDQLMNKDLQKEYVCRVVGEFPDGEVLCDQPLQNIDHKISMFRVHPSGKPSKTFFRKLSYNGKTSVVKCYPVTGRTHQIRVHLQYLGHPIVNDPLYNSSAFGPNRGKGGEIHVSNAELSAEIQRKHNIGLWYEGENPLYHKRLKEIRENKEKSHSIDKTEICDKNSEMECITDVDTSSSEPAQKRMKIEKTENDSMNPESQIDTNSLNHQDNIESTPINDNKVQNMIISESSPQQGNHSDKFQGDSNYKNSYKSSNCSNKCRKIEYNSFDELRWIPDEDCSSCKRNYIDPQPADLVMFLHALSYKGPDWEYKTDLPDWAKENWQDDISL